MVRVRATGGLQRKRSQGHRFLPKNSIVIQFSRTIHHITPVGLAVLTGILSGCVATAPIEPELQQRVQAARDVESLLVIDCLLPGQVRQLGTRLTYLTPRRPVKTSANDCEIRGGEYVAYDRASFATSLKIWLPAAEEGDAEAQTYVGEIYEKGLGVSADYTLAAAWYRRAANQGYARAQINLGYLLESGLGVNRDLTEAMNWYRQASGISEGELEYVSSAENVRRILAKEELSDLRVEVAQLQSALQQKSDEINTQSEAVQALREEVRKRRNEAIAASERADDALAIPGKLLVKINGLESQLNTSRREQTRLTVQLRDQQLATLDARLKFSAANKALADKQEDQDRLEAQLQSTQFKLADTGIQAAEKKRLQEDLVRLTDLISRQQNQIDSLSNSQSKESLALQSQISLALQAELKLKQNLDSRNQQIVSLQNQLLVQRQSYQSDVSTLQARLSAQQLDIDNFQGSISELQNERTRLQQELEKQNRERDLAMAEQNRLSLKLAEAQLTNTTGGAERTRLIAQLSNSENAFTASQQEQLRLQDKLLDLEFALNQKQNEANDNSAQLERVIAERERTVDQQRSEITRLQKEIKSARKALAVTVAPDEIQALELQLAQREDALGYALEEQKRLSTKLMDVQLTTALKDRESAARLAELEAQLIASEQSLALQRQEFETLEGEVTQAESKITINDADKVAAVIAAGPSIEIIEPPQRITRGVPGLPWQSQGDTTDIIGKVTPAEDLLSLRVNGAQVQLNEAGVFTYSHNRNNGSSISIAAVNKSGEREEANFEFALPSTDSKPEATTILPSKKRPNSIPGVNFGDYHALIIGNYDYSQLTDLETSENDARTLDRVLREKYGFQTRLVLNANKNTLLSELNNLRETLTSKDNLIIYYAGHGELDQDSNRGYWLPVDASPSDSSNWVSNKAITDTIDSIKAKHVMVVADSCYSGTLTRTAVPRRDVQLSEDLTSRWYKVVSNSRVRVVLSSGGVKPVYDRLGNSEHSVFAEALLEELEENDGILEAYDLYTHVQQKVIAEARANNVIQNPQYAPIKHAGHEAGEFFFLPNQDATTTSMLQTPDPALYANNNNN